MSSEIFEKAIDRQEVVNLRAALKEIKERYRVLAQEEMDATCALHDAQKVNERLLKRLQRQSEEIDRLSTPLDKVALMSRIGELENFAKKQRDWIERQKDYQDKYRVLRSYVKNAAATLEALKEIHDEKMSEDDLEDDEDE